MKTLITVDYELFSGEIPGTVRKCLIDPVAKLTQLGEKYDTRFTFFIDVLYLVKLQQYINDAPCLQEDYN